MAHSYFYPGNREDGIAAALRHASDILGLSVENNPDVIVFRYGLFSVEDARKVIQLAEQSAMGAAKLIVIAPERIFHEAQNALLKLFEEPPVGTTLVLVVPSPGVLLGTLRSRMLPLERSDTTLPEIVRDFLAARAPEREKMVAKLLERTKSDKEEEKQAARGDALRLAEGLMRAAQQSLLTKEQKAVRDFVRDLERFIPILHERSAPLKLMFEHILLTVPPLPKA